MDVVVGGRGCSAHRSAGRADAVRPGLALPGVHQGFRRRHAARDQRVRAKARGFPQRPTRGRQRSTCSTGTAGTWAATSQGQVKGDEIACPFHDWRWGGDGRCKQVPYSRRAPKLARTQAWTTLQQDGMLFVWNDPEAQSAAAGGRHSTDRRSHERRVDRLALVRHRRAQQLPRDHRQRGGHGALLLHPRLIADAFQEHLRRAGRDAVHERRSRPDLGGPEGSDDARDDIGGVRTTARPS